MSDDVINSLQSLSDCLIKQADKSISKWEERAYKKTKKRKPSGRDIVHCDFLTPEYKSFNVILDKKWETCRGIGNSFGYNKFESEADYSTSEKLIRNLVDIVSKNGNLLLNVGPKADGTLPEIQKKCLIDIGDWLNINGEAIYNTRPWIKAEGYTLEGIDVRFTRKDNKLYIILLEKPAKYFTVIENLFDLSILKIYLLGFDGELSWNYKLNQLKIFLPKDLWNSPAYSFQLVLSGI